jgi:hypothetical protein
MTANLPKELLAAFDRGVDPLLDAELREWLLQHPEQLAAFASLRAQLHEVSQLPLATAWPAAPQRPWLPIAFAAGLLAAASVLWLWLVGMPAGMFRSAPEPALPRPRLAPAAAVQAVLVTTVTQGPRERHERTQRHGMLARQAIESHTTAGADQPNLTFQSTLSIAKNLAP